MQRTAPHRLTFMTSRSCSVDASSTTAFDPTPALLTRTSTFPVASRTSVNPSRTDWSSAMSTRTSRTSTPASLAIAASFSARATSRTVPYTSWPCPARWMAVARPMPEFAPVTMLTVDIRGTLGPPAERRAPVELSLRART